ncbi:precorrin-6y C5,15-methyltransferase (decarboxylating) subunit CbiE [Tautonia plasticadhaerens]|uniref:Precorrin-6Y C(5,15)-methyltransferase [decarboxylating] n=1 Tax=Tautonia plasticadhaerens TaxID=2527974 RepID=A0A518GW36_9BACT|nr:precorrin-6y C5,15-methyltransferase (decarboxylating) subunit CbiE [Tautonia plasticadhaerens]QDV32802.1 Precorrin-6Y C(5,15)-methyltransferase [decarboxylating] [Tautonia plasticadhaerens]
MAESSSKVVILGVGDDGLSGLTESARVIVAGADLILGAPAALKAVEEAGGRKVALSSDMGRAVDQVREAMDSAGRPVLVSTGDPLFYGIARYLCDRLGEDRFEIVPHVSSMQLAFARVKESWDDAYLADLGSRPVEAIVSRIRNAEKVGLFSSDRCPPRRLARAMLDRGLDDFRAFVCEHLGSPDERVTQAGLAELAEMDFDPLHVLILVRDPDLALRADRHGGRLRFGNPDELFSQNQPRRSLVTTAEVRAIALAQLNIRADSVVWDVGAGSGSVAIEAAQLATQGQVFAVEPRADDLALIPANAERFGVEHVRAVAGRAPEALADLPDPDAVFVGGTGRHVGSILRAAHARLRTGGRLVVNVASVEALVEAHRLLKELTRDVQVWDVHVSRGVEQLDRLRFHSSSPSYLLAVGKAAE